MSHSRILIFARMIELALELCGWAALWYNTANRENWDEKQA